MEQKLFTRNFTLLILGQASSLFGNYILRLALSMYVLEATGSAAVFAGLLSIAVIPTILLSPLGGVLADRANKRNLMVALDALTGAAVLATAVLLTEENAIAVIGALLVGLSILGAFETPTVQACIPQMLTGDNIIKGNAVVNQVASVSYLTAPMIGGVFYGAVGLKPVIVVSVICFFITALLECLIQLDTQPGSNYGFLSIVKEDLLVSFHFMVKERTDIMNMLFLVAFSRFFVMGITLIGLPFLVRTVLGLDAAYYGTAESCLAVAVIMGSIAAGMLTGKLKYKTLSFILAAIGICSIPAGVAFLLPANPFIRYMVLVASFSGMEIAVSIFSVFAVSMIQQNTPGNFIGKIMAYTSTITMCAQPAGQMVYGVLFDRWKDSAALVLIPSGIAVGIIGFLSTGCFKRLEEKPRETS